MTTIAKKDLSVQILEALQQINQRLDRMEQRINMYETTVPQLAATAVDYLDSSYLDLKNKGIDFSERMEIMPELIMKASEPRLLNLLSNILDKADDLEKGLKMLDALPGTISTVTDIMDEFYLSQKEKGVDLTERLEKLNSLVIKASSPEKLELVSHLLDKTGDLEKGLKMLDALPGTISTITDIMDEIYRNAVANKHELLDTLRYLRANFPVQDSLKAAKALTDAIGQAKKDFQPAGFFSMLKAFTEPEIQSLLGFLLIFAKAFSNSVTKANTNS